MITCLVAISTSDFTAGQDSREAAFQWRNQREIVTSPQADFCSVSSVTHTEDATVGRTLLGLLDLPVLDGPRAVRGPYSDQKSRGNMWENQTPDRVSGSPRTIRD